MPYQATTPSSVNSGFLARLRRDRRGSTLSIVAASIFPLLAMVGGGIDVSRLYMARTRLQQACDAGALAGRRTMADPVFFTAADRRVARRFFDFDFPAATYLATDVTRTFARGAFPGTVTGSASIMMPTTVMKIFGFGQVKLAVTCESTLVVPNTDIMFVLDVTGSMAETPSGDDQTKIASLREAVTDFYKALGPGAANGPGRIRYGFMPYSSNVNVGRLVRAQNASWIAGGNGSELWKYQSREATTEKAPTYGNESADTNGASTDGATTWTPANGYTNDGAATTTKQSACTATDPPDTVTSSTRTLQTDENPPVYPDNQRDRTYKTVEQRSKRDNDVVWTKTGNGKDPDGTCQKRYRTGTYTRETPSSTTTPVTWVDKFKAWSYRQREIDVAGFAAGGSTANPAYYTGYWEGNDPNVFAGEATPQSFTWGGCIEEARTVNDIQASSSLEPPSDANDLNIDLIPSSIETRWKPYLPQLQYLRFGNSVDWYYRSNYLAGGISACPREASRLDMYANDVNAQTGVSTRFANYVDSLQPIGGTYHDIGLIWGARFLSPDGIFSAANSNTAAPGQFAVDRHIVFMTDGALSTSNITPDPWGINFMDARVAPADADTNRMNETHLRRTSIICEQMRGKGYTVWVVGFGISTMPIELQRCAKDADHWSLSQNSEELRTRFQQIAQLIGGLRLTQ